MTASISEAELDALEAMLKKLSDEALNKLNNPVASLVLGSAASAIASLRSRCAALEKDARRYRWLHEADSEIYKDWHWSVERYDHRRQGWDVLDGNELDAAIDAALAAQSTGEKP